MGEQVVIPVGMRGRSGVGSDDDKAVTVLAVAERGGTLLAASGAGGGEQEDGAVGEPAAELAAVGPELGDQVLVELAHVDVLHAAHGDTSYGTIVETRRAKAHPVHGSFSPATINMASAGRMTPAGPRSERSACGVSSVGSGLTSTRSAPARRASRGRP